MPSNIPTKFEDWVDRFYLENALIYCVDADVPGKYYRMAYASQAMPHITNYVNDTLYRTIAECNADSKNRLGCNAKRMKLSDFSAL